MEAENGVAAIKMRGLKVIRAMVTKASRLVGKTAAEVDFRDTYKSAIVAIQQGGKNISQSLSSVKLTAGDVLVLQASDESPLLLQPPDDFYKDHAASGSRSSSSFVKLVTRRFGGNQNVADTKDTDYSAPVEDDLNTDFANGVGGNGHDPEQQVSAQYQPSAPRLKPDANRMR